MHTGTVHGNHIELTHSLGLPDGAKVIVTVQQVTLEDESLAPGDGLRLSQGAWADAEEELDEFLAWNRQQRKHSRPEISP